MRNNNKPQVKPLNRRRELIRQRLIEKERQAAMKLDQKLAKLEELRLIGQRHEKCAVVGNATSLLDREWGTEIDSFNTVVRINRNEIVNKTCQGSKTSIIFAHHTRARQINQLGTPGNCPLINVSTDIEVILDTWTQQLRTDVGCTRARPTTGFLATACMIDMGFTPTLFGFDFFQTPSIHASGPYWEFHYPDWERQILTKWAVVK